VVYARSFGKQTITLLVSGKLWRNSLIMQDEETGTLWSHVSGEGLEGPHEGERLETLPMVQSTWGEWRRAHPETKVLRKSEAVSGSHYEGYFTNPDRVGIFRSRYNEERLPAKSRVFGLSSGPHALAIAEARLTPDEPLNLSLDGRPVVVYRSSDGGTRAFAASLSGVELRFEYDGKKRGIRDGASGTMWDLSRGVGVSGKYKGRRLEELQVLRAFWFAWSSFYPNTAVVD
jgi:hypothetical protein